MLVLYCVKLVLTGAKGLNLLTELVFSFCQLFVASGDFWQFEQLFGLIKGLGDGGLVGLLMVKAT